MPCISVFLDSYAPLTARENKTHFEFRFAVRVGQRVWVRP